MATDVPAECEDESRVHYYWLSIELCSFRDPPYNLVNHPTFRKAAHKHSKLSKIWSFFNMKSKNAPREFQTTHSQVSLKISSMLQAMKRDSRLCRLPAELLLTIVDYLDDASAVCLKMTSRYMYSGILPNLDYAALSNCAKWRLACHLEQEAAVPIREYLACAFCKSKHHRKQFVPYWGGGGGAYRRFGVQLLNLTKCRPEARYCMKWVDRVLIEDTQILPPTNWFRGPDRFRRWERYRELACMHCNYAIPPSDRRKTGCARCCCDICPRRFLPRLRRMGPASNNDDHTDIAKLKETKGDLYIVEKPRWTFSTKRKGRAVPVIDEETREAVKAATGK